MNNETRRGRKRELAFDCIQVETAQIGRDKA